jgi:conjugative relaxase-like TrwC/TraI family protein
MMTLSKGSLSARQAARYYQEKYARDDYYSEDRTVAGQWVGAGAEQLGLVGAVAREDFTAVLDGRDPRTGTMLVESVPEKERRAGWDATFIAPKSVSLQALVGNDARLLAAHRVAVTTALTELERFVQTRQHGGQERVTTGNMIAATFTHVAARPSQSGHAQGLGPDPHLHTHVVLMNMTRRADGVWRAVEPLELYRSQEHATAVYRTTLAREVQRVGYRIARTGQLGAWELEGFSRTQIEQFSQRRQDISRYLQERGLDSPAAAQIAAHQTRLPKEGRDETALRVEWMARAAAIGLDLSRVTDAAQRRGPLEHDASEQQERARDAVDYATAHRTEREAVVDARALEATALQRGMGMIDLDHVRTEIGNQAAQRRLVPVTSARSPVDSYTTPEMLGLEEENIDLMWAGQGQAEPVAEAREVFAWALQRGLYVDQMRVAVQTLTAKDWLTAIEGKAGATKTTTIGALRELIEQQGMTVQGFGPTTGSVRALVEAGINARTVASLLASHVQREQSTSLPRSVWIVDESSLLSTRQVHGLLQRAREEGIGRVIFVGDQRQHGAIEAGKPMAQLQQAGMGTARLDVIRRQQDPALRAAVSLAAQGKTAQAAQQLIRQGRVTGIADRDARFALIAREYARHVEQKQQVLVVSPANAERVALNAAIRAELQQRGTLPRESATQTVLVRRDLTAAEKAWTGSYEVGEVIQYHRGSAKLSIPAKSYATVEAVDREQNLLTVRTTDRTVQYRPTQLRGVEVFRAEPREFAEGERIQFRAPLKEQHIANGALGRIENIAKEKERVTLRMDNGKIFAAPWDALRHIEYGYTTTSHSSQGMTVDRVLVQIDTDRSAQLVNRQQFYVSISRARLEVQVFTNNVERLPAVVARELVKTTAREAVQGEQREQGQAQKKRHARAPEQERRAQIARQGEWRAERNRLVTPGPQPSLPPRRHTQHERSRTLPVPGEHQVGWRR